MHSTFAARTTTAKRAVRTPGLVARPTPPRTIVLIDGHQTFCDLFHAVVGGNADLACVGVATTLDAGLALVRRARPDVVVVGLQFPDDDRDGLDAAAVLTGEDPVVRVVLLTHGTDAALLPRAAAAQVSSLVSKDGALPDLYDALRTAHRGGLTVHPQLLRSLASRPAPPASLAHMSPRQRDVLDLLFAGHDVRRIARTLGISLNTCRQYVKTLLARLDAHSQLEAVAIARRQGYRPRLRA